jgi:hypothetical protein
MKNFKSVGFATVLLLTLFACTLSSSSSGSKNPPFTIEITNPDTFPDDGELSIALCENEINVLASNESKLAIQAIENKRWDPTSNGSMHYGAYINGNLADSYSSEKDASDPMVLNAENAKIVIPLWRPQQKSASACPIISLPVFTTESKTWKKIGMCPFDKIIVSAYFQGERINQVSSGCKVDSKSVSLSETQTETPIPTSTKLPTETPPQINTRCVTVQGIVQDNPDTNPSYAGYPLMKLENMQIIDGVFNYSGSITHAFVENDSSTAEIIPIGTKVEVRGKVDRGGGETSVYDSITYLEIGVLSNDLSSHDLCQSYVKILSP